MRPRDTGPFRTPPIGRLLMKATRDDAFGAEWIFVVDGLPMMAGLRLAGTLRGPDRGRDATLPVTVPLASVSSPAGRVAARAVLTEPATWTPELPNRYRLEARLEGGDPVDEAWRQPFGGWIGLRRLGVRGRSFRLDGRRFVLRGGPTVPVAGASRSLAAVRDRHHAVLVDAAEPAFVAGQSAGGTLDELLEEADREGMFVAVVFAASQAGSLAARLAFHPSAAFAIARERGAADAFAAHRTPSGPLLGLAVDGGSPPPSDCRPADFLVVRLAAGELPHDAWLASPPSLPLVACRPADEAHPAGAAAHPCDALQATLARWGVDRAGPVLSWDWSGYFAAAW